MNPPMCPKCNSVMELGYVLDQAESASVQSLWIRGAPVHQTVFGVVMRAVVIEEKKSVIPITTYKCTRCGFLESYAIPN